MGDIYRQAHNVCFWLGVDGENEAARVFTYFRLLELESDPVDPSRVFADEDDGIDQLERFFERDWFYRRWVSVRPTSIEKCVPQNL
ncbi:hypothetical protein BDV96DRAFT_570716 [Lophiotrema nucula]|uniref:Heterokaryon incompatibility domain-containing protein n=1 Tax=Lophiotrema nucula TaxID=690887 RepID=A0A6A5ZH35_9PLEO|nr:hypothetical protein BDV96DRAFT_570716 [Lophiotrema nucula]